MWHKLTLGLREEISLVYAPSGATLMLKTCFGHISETNKVQELRLGTNTAAFRCLEMPTL